MAHVVRVHGPALSPPIFAGLKPSELLPFPFDHVYDRTAVFLFAPPFLFGHDFQLLAPFRVGFGSLQSG
jgi:hypothetical protein